MPPSPDTNNNHQNDGGVRASIVQHIETMLRNDERMFRWARQFLTRLHVFKGTLPPPGHIVVDDDTFQKLCSHLEKVNDHLERTLAQSEGYRELQNQLGGYEAIILQRRNERPQAFSLDWENLESYLKEAEIGAVGFANASLGPILTKYRAWHDAFSANHQSIDAGAYLNDKIRTMKGLLGQYQMNNITNQSSSLEEKIEIGLKRIEGLTEYIIRVDQGARVMPA